MTGQRFPLRCPGQTWGIVEDATGAMEVRCTDRFCRTAEGSAVIHRFQLEDGSFTTRIADEAPPRKEQDHGLRYTTV